MFTGIILDKGRLISKKPLGEGCEFSIASSVIRKGLQLGDSVACNGTCLTVTQLLAEGFMAHAVHETLSKTNLGQLKQGDFINLETALKPSQPMGGHFVSGHVDGQGKVSQIKVLGDQSWVLDIELDLENNPGALNLCVEKGSITLNGASLTIAKLLEKGVQIALIPHTLQVTNLGNAQVGTLWNYELDILGKYVQRLMQGKMIQTMDVSNSGKNAPDTINTNDLLRWGYGV